eukprot:650422-Rhodomonas_salina.1
MEATATGTGPEQRHHHRNRAAPATRGAGNLAAKDATTSLLNDGSTHGRNPQLQRRETGYVRLCHPMDARGTQDEGAQRRLPAA